MSAFLKLFGAALLAACAASLLRGKNGSFAAGVSVLAAILIFSGVADCVSEIASFIRDLSENTAAASYVPVLMKAVGFAWLTEICVGICRSAGEERVASAVEIAGRCEILALALPYVRELVDVALGMLK